MGCRNDKLTPQDIQEIDPKKDFVENQTGLQILDEQAEIGALNKHNQTLQISREDQLRNKYEQELSSLVLKGDTKRLGEIYKDGFCSDWIFNVGEQVTTLLLMSIAYKNAELIDLGLQYCTNIDSQIEESKETALICAIHTGDPKIVKQILKKRPNKQLKNSEGLNAIQLADSILKQQLESATNYQIILNLLL